MEMEAFVELLQSQKRIREAQTENEELAALLKRNGDRLISEDELDAVIEANKGRYGNLSKGDINTI